MKLNLTLLGYITLFLKTMMGETIEVDVHPLDRIEIVKLRISQKEGIPPYQQRLVYSGRLLEDGCTLCDYNIQRESAIHLIILSTGQLHMYIHTYTCMYIM